MLPTRLRNWCYLQLKTGLGKAMHFYGDRTVGSRSAHDQNKHLKYLYMMNRKKLRIKKIHSTQNEPKARAAFFERFQKTVCARPWKNPNNAQNSPKDRLCLFRFVIVNQDASSLLHVDSVVPCRDIERQSCHTVVILRCIESIDNKLADGRHCSLIEQ
jgi:hypothetical protein